MMRQGETRNVEKIRSRELAERKKATLHRAMESSSEEPKQPLTEALLSLPSEDLQVSPRDLYNVDVNQELPSTENAEDKAKRDEEENNNLEEAREEYQPQVQVAGRQYRERNRGGHRYSLRQRPHKDYSDFPAPEADEILFCEECQRAWEGDCPEHGSLVRLFNTAVPPAAVGTEEYAALTVPSELAVAASSIPGAERGIWTRVALPKGLRMGPYEGVHSRSQNDPRYSWQIRRRGRPSHFVDASDSRVSNWMRFVNCAHHEGVQNLEAIQFRGSIFYRTTRDLAANEELLL